MATNQSSRNPQVISPRRTLTRRLKTRFRPVTRLRQVEQPELSRRTAKKLTKTNLIRSSRLQART
jgi:hypothetical protein